ncbi:MAG TPA: Hsp33 family molecular chaperone [Caulobacteraceae bacterium]|nr:Hsp33 family molecular chaperone [Caulobacteraceae bacterium]
MTSASTTLLADDYVAPFQIEGQSVRGRIVRLGAAIDEVLTRHDYPQPVANLLGEACVLAALVGASLKADGRLIVQAQGDGPVKYVVADYDTDGALRGYCRYDADRIETLAEHDAHPGARALIGEGAFTMTLDPGQGGQMYQGITPVEGDTLAACAEAYFDKSEQLPTRIRLAVGAADEGAGPAWRAGGLLIQNIAADEARGATVDDWEKAEALFSTTAEDELIDPTVSSQRLLWRLFHEDGVRLFASRPLRAFCRCSEERIIAMLRAFDADERAGMVEADGCIRVTCEYCSREYRFQPERV